MKSVNRVNSITQEAGLRDGRQMILGTAIQKLSATEKNAADEKFALFFYMNNLPFKLAQSSYYLTFSNFIAPAYTLPNEKALRTTLLDQSYQSLKDEIDNRLRASFCLNIITDESENISKDRIINLSIGTDMGIFHYRSENVGSMAFTADNIANWIMQKLDDLLRGDWNRINSFATDTCSTMLAVWKILSRDERLLNARCLFVPCDSHGLQLLIGDILTIPRYSNIQFQVSTIINAFRSSPKQLALLRDKQLEINGKKSALIVSVITRWGTHAKAIESLYRNKESLRQYAIDVRCDINNRVQEIILNRTFWADLEDMREIISVIYEAQKKSESDKSHLGYVAARWLEIRDHLIGIARRQPGAEVLLPIFEKRMNRQVRDIHWAAYYLNPINVGAPTTIARQNAVLRYFTVVKPDHESHKCQTAFFHYRAHFGAFYDANPAWRLADSDPIAFWNAMHPFANEISTAAIRLFKTPANSVPSERSFSIQNFIHNKVRNRLDPIRVDKLTFIYMNRRVLDRAIQPVSREFEAVRWEDLDDEEELELEDQLLFQNPMAAQINEQQIVEQLPAEIEIENEPGFNHYYSPDPSRHYSPNPFNNSVHRWDPAGNEHPRISTIDQGKQT